MLGFYRTYTTPFKEKIPASVDDFFSRVSLLRRFNRFFGRYLYAEISLINSKSLDRISRKHQRLLWIQWVDSYLGDSLMDLSSRILFKNRKIDLLTKENVANIYHNDSVFERIFTKPEQCNPNDYDLLIIDSYRQRSLKTIADRFLHIPHVTLYGYYNVDDFNRLYFSFFRVNQLLSHPYNEQEIKSMAKPLLTITSADEQVVENYHLPNNFITIAIGGASKERTYHAWGDLVDTLIVNKITDNIVLVGSQDAKNSANLIYNKNPDRVVNLVGKCSFKQSAQVINKSKLLVCADGGLLHAANAVKTPIIGLFYYIDPAVRLIDVNKSYGLIDKTNINNINNNRIVKKIQLLLE